MLSIALANCYRFAAEYDALPHLAIQLGTRNQIGRRPGCKFFNSYGMRAAWWRKADMTSLFYEIIGLRRNH
jgi:hypothetical protein